MSFTIVEPRRQRLNRTEQTVPGSNPRFLEKATASPADIILFDLEDSVAPDEKERARRNVIAAIHDQDWGDRTLSVRINGLDTPYMYRDVIEVVEQAGERLDQPRVRGRRRRAGSAVEGLARPLSAAATTSRRR